jgi:hypothetical protein
MTGFLGFLVWLGLVSVMVCAGLTCGGMRRTSLAGFPKPASGAGLPRVEPVAGAVQRAAWTSAAAWLDLEAEVTRALQRAVPAAARSGVQLVRAAPPGLAVRTDRRTLAAALAAVLEHAIAASPCGKVLLTARRDGPVMEVAVLDDGTAADPATRRAALRPVESSIGLQGGSLEVAAIAGEGTTVRLRLPAPALRPQPAAATPAGTPTGAVSMIAG